MAVNLSRLTEPFDRGQIKQREGARGKMLDYVGSGDIIKHVIDCTENNYDWVVARLELLSDAKGAFWFCLGTLTIPGLGTRSGAGTSRVENEDSPKSAETDAYKRAAVKFGVALDLYLKPSSPQNAQRPQQDRDDYRPQGQFRPGQAPATAVNGSGESCPDCHAPAGKPHGTNCKVVRA